MNMLQAQEFEMPRAQAEKILSEANGDLVKALNTLGTLLSRGSDV